jgi:ribokinase
MIGRVGDDDFGGRLRRTLADCGVNLAHVTIDRQHCTGVAVIIVQASGENSIVVARGANDAVSPHDVEAGREIIQRADVMLLQLEISLDAVATAIAVARAAGVKVIVDAGPACPLPDDLLRAPDVLSPNLIEAEALLGHPIASGLEAARELRTRGAAACVVKSGAAGCAWASPQGSGEIAAIPVQAVDTTAAGDAFTAALGVALAEGRDLESAAAWANHAGALAVTRLGAQPSMPTRAELEGFISRRS